MYVRHEWQLDEVLKEMGKGKLTLEKLNRLCPGITAYLDKDSKHIAMDAFMGQKGQVDMMCLWDPPAHELSNASKNGVADAGQEENVKFGGMIKNFIGGPWDKLQWYRKLQGAGRELGTKANHTHKFIQSAWPSVCWEHGWTEQSQTDNAACDAWCQSLGNSTLTSVKHGSLRAGG